MDQIARQLAQCRWPYADQDPVALRQISRRIADIGRCKKLIPYSELVSGIEFHIPTVNQGRPLRLGDPEWTDLHRAILGDFLGRLCVDTYTEGGFMGSALVVSTGTREPSEGYRNLMRDLGLLHSRNELEFLAHWIAETKKAYAWYAQGHRSE